MSRRLTIALLVLNCVACAAILGVRFSSNLRAGALYPTNGSESLMAYSLWKVQHGFPLYEWPNRNSFSLTLYNWLFYYLYASLLSGLRMSDARLLVYGRILTFCFCALGIAGSAALMLRSLPETLRKRALLLAIMTASLVWLSTSFLGWYVLTIRPDVIAVSIATFAMLATLCAVDRDSSVWMILSALLYYASWSMKQSAIALLLGVCLFFLLSRRFRLLGVLIATFGTLVVFTLAIGGEVYRYNILAAPRVVASYSWHDAFSEWGKVIILNLIVWILAALAVVRLGARGWKNFLEAPVLAMMTCTLLAGVPLASLLLSKQGAAKNHLLEVFVAAAALAFSELAPAIIEPQQNQLRYVVLLLALAWLAYPAAQLGYLIAFGSSSQGQGLRTGDFGLGSVSQLKQGRTPWHVQLAFPEQLAQRQKLASQLQSLPKPLYIRDEVLLLPWYATDDRYPAYNPDPIYESAAVSRGLMQPSLLQLLRQHHFASVVLADNDSSQTEALAAGYIALAPSSPLRVEGFHVFLYPTSRQQESRMQGLDRVRPISARPRPLLRPATTASSAALSQRRPG